MTTVYSIPNCSFCEKAKELLTEKGLTYNEIDLTTNEHAKQYVIHKTQQKKVPVIEIDGKLIVGFDNLTEYFNKVSK